MFDERRGRACSASGTRKSRTPKLDKKIEKGLIAENQRFWMRIEYLKTESLSFCGRARERQKGKNNIRTKAKVSVKRIA